MAVPLPPPSPAPLLPVDLPFPGQKPLLTHSKVCLVEHAGEVGKGGVGNFPVNLARVQVLGPWKPPTEETTEAVARFVGIDKNIHVFSFVRKKTPEEFFFPQRSVREEEGHRFRENFFEPPLIRLALDDDHLLHAAHPLGSPPRSERNPDLRRPRLQRRRKRSMVLSENSRSKPESERMFVAVPVPASVRVHLAARTDHLLRTFPFQTTVHPQDYHITLLFLGDVPTARIAELRTVLGEAVRPLPSFRLTLGSLGTFGPEAHPSVLYVRIRGEEEKLAELTRRVRAAAERLGLSGDRKPFVAHLTLARRYRGVKPYSPAEAARIWGPEDDGTITSFAVDEVILFASHLGRRPMYEPRAAFPLEG